MASKPEATAASPDVPAEVAEKASLSAGEEAQRSMLNIMRDKFKNEKRVTVKVRNDSDVFLQVNGYSFLIKPNTKVEVPESIVPLLEDAGYL
jgi:hypothetical protein